MKTSNHRGQAGVIILIIIVILLFIGIGYYATRTSLSNGGPTGTTTSTQATGTPGASSQGTNYYNNIATWQTDNRTDAGFSIKYPLDFTAVDNMSLTQGTEWRNDTTDPGILALTITIPKAFEPQTNFQDAKLTVGYSANTMAIKHCMDPLPSGNPASQASASTTISGVPFSVFTGSDAGAGNLYDTVSYRGMHAGKCYAIDYVIHSTQLANYPASYGLTQFDEAKVRDVMDRIAGTVAFK